jgi:hypothetical protein
MNDLTATEKLSVSNNTNANEHDYHLGVPTLNDGTVYPIRTGSTKQGHSFCGVCCDMRRCVIIINCVYVIISLLDLSAEKFAMYPFGWFDVMIYFKIVLCAVGIVGAVQFNIYLVAIPAVMYLLEAIFAAIVIITDNSYGVYSLLLFGYYSLPVCCILLYPHILFIIEKCRGIMTKENYHNEEQSCCCV